MRAPWLPIRPGLRSVLVAGNLSLLAACDKFDGKSDVASCNLEGQAREHLPVEGNHCLYV